MDLAWKGGLLINTVLLERTISGHKNPNTKHGVWSPISPKFGLSGNEASFNPSNSDNKSALEEVFRGDFCTVVWKGTWMI